MTNHFENVFAVIFGALMVLFNNSATDMTMRFYNTWAADDRFSYWLTRFGFVFVGLLFIVSGIVSW